MRKKSAVVGCIICIAFIYGICFLKSSFAQDSEYGFISGRVLSRASNQPFEDVIIILRSIDPDKYIANVKTDNTGYYEFAKLLPATYKIIVGPFFHNDKLFKRKIIKKITIRENMRIKEKNVYYPLPSFYSIVGLVKDQATSRKIVDAVIDLYKIKNGKWKLAAMAGVTMKNSFTP